MNAEDQSITVRLDATGGSATITTVDDCEVYSLYPLSLAWLGGSQSSYEATGYENYAEYHEPFAIALALLQMFEATLGEN
jgi:hypothetical protein